MKRLSFKTIIISLVLIVAMSLMLVGCSNRGKEYTPDKQGSKVMTIDERNITGYETTVFNSFGEFTGSDYAGMHLDGSSYAADMSYYGKHYWRRHSLIATRFNDVGNIHHFINKIVKVDNTYTVTILRFRDASATETAVQSYACFLEITTRFDLPSDTKVVIDMQPIMDIPPYTKGKSTTDTTNDVSLALIPNIGDLTAHMSQVDKETAHALAQYDAKFFESKALMVLDLLAYDDSIFTYDYISSTGTYNINVYHSDHYKKNTDIQHHMMIYIPVSRSITISQMMLNTYWETDVDSSNIDKHQVIDMSNIIKKYSK